MTVDLSTIYREGQPRTPPLFHCPYCGQGVRGYMRCPYPAHIAGAFSEIYRCRSCRRFIGAPISREEHDEP